ELRGIPCLALEDVPPQRKGCAVTRSFGEPVTTLAGMLEAVAAYATRAGEKLRRHGLETDHMAVFMHTSAFRPGDRPYSGSTVVHLPEASADTLDLVRAAKRGARAIWRDGYRYAKAGIVMTDLVPAGTAQRPLFDARDRERSDKLMTAIDAVNGKFGRGTIMPAAAGIKQKWATKFEMRTPRYTTRIKEIPRVAAE
ncbi:DUF4113 domain-containing protein, partial [Aureimonas psammosilenae]|uniref:DUF4113 domain-containing protein n=1 Tax=Aureimonas psammosilenae TaxID=2495496 RepID=UPI0012612F80